MIELPYGIADFLTIRRQGLVYLDRTAHIRDVESLGRALVFLRPRRFGKSLWLRTLANYYDLRRKDELDELFGGLAIGRDPTPLANRYFILRWNFSKVDPSGNAAQIAESLHRHVRSRARVFVSEYEDHLPAAVRTDAADPQTILDSLTSAVLKTPYKLYLLIDEYDNFVNEVMVEDVDTYHALFAKGGPYKQLFKAVKDALKGEGMERVFVTGVSPVALNDLTSGFNNAENVSLEPELAALCGFRQKEIEDLLERIAADRALPPDDFEEALDTLRTWYNGYRFTEATFAEAALSEAGTADGEVELVYNPTNVLYFLKHLHRRGSPPRQLHDVNLRTDRGKLAFLARTAAGAGLVEQLTEGDGEITIPHLEDMFSLDDLTQRLEQDRGAIASMLYYMGLLTQTQTPGRLRIPNLVVRKLFLDRLLEIFLPDAGDSSGAREVAMTFFQDGELEPLLTFFEQRLLPVLSNRDRGAAPRQPGQSGSGVNEMVLKTLFLSILFDDTRYVTFSELEVRQGYADLCLLVRPEMRPFGYFDLVFELKLVRRKELGVKGKELRSMDEGELRRLRPVAKALADARDQIAEYRTALAKKFGASTLKLRSYVVVAVGLERMLGEEHS